MSDPKTKGTAQGEPSMEEILASIRRIISEDGDPAKAPPPPVAAPPAPVPEPTPAPRAAATPPTPPKPPEPAVTEVLELTEVVEDTPPAPPEPVVEEDSLVSTSVASAASDSLASLLSARRQTDRSMVNNPMPLGNGGLTIEAIVREELRPILKAWLDQNLTPMVERMVQREIQRITSNLH